MNWNNTTAATGEAIALNASDGTDSGATLTYAANGTWNDEAASTDPFLQYFLGDNREGGTTITVSNVPFDTYDVIVYLNSDTENTSFLPVSINGTKYIGDPETGATEVTEDANKTFGETRAAAPQYGLNAIRVNGITDATLNILGSRQQTIDNVTRRCNIAGFQIVESLPLSISVNYKGTANSNNADQYPETLVGDTTGFSGLIPVVNANWNEVETPTGDGSTPEIIGAKDSTGAETTATISLAIGGGWTLKGLSQEVQNARTTRIGKMGLGYADASKNTTPEVTLSDIPYTEYSVILYYATDNSGKQWAPAKVTSGDTDTYYYYGEDGTLKSDDTYTSTWGSSDDCIAAATTGTLSKDTMRIDGLSGDVSIDLDTSSNTDNTRGGLSGLQIVCTGKVIVPPPPTINVNFASGRAGGDTSHDRALTGATTYGLEPVPGSEWKNLYKGDRNNDVALAVCNGETSVVPTVTYNASGMWSYEEDIEGINDLLFAALDDASALSGTSNNTTITVSDVPFTQYDVIVYLQATGQGGGFKPVEVNGSYYSWQGGATQAVTDSSDTYAWGTLSQPQPVLGVNALRIAGQTARELTINAPVRTGDADNSKRCNVTGFQIVCTGEVIEDFLDPAKEGVISLNFNSGTHNSAIPATETTYGLVAVPGSKWQNLTGTSNADGVAITTASNTELSGTPTVTFSSTGGWQYDANQTTCPYLRGYLDDGGDGVSVNVANVPYGAYDAVVYLAGDVTGRPFNPVQVNDTYYTWDEALETTVSAAGRTDYFGDGAAATAAYGTNTLRVKALDGALAIRTLPRQDVGDKVCRGGLAAVQLVERKVIEVSGTGFDLTGALAAYDNDTPVLITFAEGATVTGNVMLPADAVVDLTDYAFGETAPFGGALAVNAGTEIRLPGGAVSYTLASSITGSLGLVMQDGAYITDASISGGTITRPVTYEWTGAGTDTNWTTAANWSSGVEPDENAAVTVTLAANDAKTITLNKAATVASLTITGPASGSATLTIATAEGVEGAKLTVVDKMFTTGNVTVTQNASIAVNGATQMGDGSPIPANQVVQAGFQVNGTNAKYTVKSGALEVQVPGSGSGDVSVSNGAILEVGADATLSADRAIVSYFGNTTSAASGTLRIAGQATFSTQVAFRTANYTVDLAGGTMTTPIVDTFNGLVVSSKASILQAPENGTMTVSGRNGSALSGAGNLTLQGTVAFSTITADYTGELTADANSTVTLGENRPKLSVAKDATVNITPTAEEQAAGVVSFTTSMTAVPNNATFKVSGVESVSAEVADGTLTLSWAASTATLATSGDWSAANWTVGETTDQAAPESGVVVLDGTAEGGITVTLNRAIPAAITTINVKGDVTLVATEEHQATLPTCINVEDGATLGVGANFAKAEGSAWPATWDIPANTTLRVTGEGFSFGGITVDNNDYIQVYADLVVTATGAEGTPALIEPENNLWCRGKVTVSGDYVTLRKLYWLDDDTDGLTVTGDNVTIEGLRRVDGTDGLTLSGNNVTITGDVKNGLAFAAGATITSSGAGNVLDGVTDWPNTFTVTSGDLTIDSCTSLKGALLSNGATLKLASDWAAGQELHVSTEAGDSSVMGLDMSAVATVNRPTLARYDSSSNALPKNLLIASSAEEDEAGEIRIALMATSKPVLPAGGLAVTVTPATEGVVWNAVATIEENTLVITNVVLKPVLPEGSTLSDAATAALNKAATEAGITGEYDVAITTKGEPVQVADAADVARLQEVLDCFTGVATGDSASNTVTVAYDFGIVDIARTADGWTVTAKVQGAAGAKADFADGNVYTLTVNGTEYPVQTATVGEGGTVTLPLADSAVQGDDFTLGVKVSRPEQTPAQ